MGVVVGFRIRDEYVSRYQPISVGNGAYEFDVLGPREDAVEMIETHASEGASWVAHVPFQKGGTLRMVFPIFHHGDRAIRITDIDIGPEPTRIATVLDPVEVEVGPQTTNNPGSERSTRPFGPFTFAPNDNPVIEFQYDCVCQRPGVNSFEIRETFNLRFELLGASRWVEIDLPWRLVLADATREECPPGSAALSYET